MSKPAKVNGVWRYEISNHARVKGIWRNKKEEYVKVNGVWRSTETVKPFNADSILGFTIIYKLARHLVHPMYPKMGFNPAIKNMVDIAGFRPITYDTDAKSILFRFLNGDYRVEGTYAYEAIMYADIVDGSSIPISTIIDSPVSANMDSISVTVDGYTLYESYGPYVTGWNRFFTDKDNLPSSASDERDLIRISSYNILPTYSRDSSYISNAYIGIARNMSSRDHNMVGSHGALDQTIESIKLNGVEKPFKIEIYD